MESNTLQSGTTLQGKAYTYTIQKVLGQGTFGITYLATTKVKVAGALGELETTMQVAIKEFFMRDINGRNENTVTTGSQGGIYDNYKKKFAREAKNLSKLSHPHIVKVLEYFETNNTVYYAMEYIDGESLDQYITREKGLPETECIQYTQQIGSALSYMHEHKMLHLDLKPGNIMLRKNKEAVLIDFGLSKQYDEEGKPESSTSIGNGTPGYAPIEQANYHEKSFPKTIDVYALGATMYKMLTGVRPPEASEILNEGFPTTTLQKCRASKQTIACIEKAMAILKKDRFQEINELLSSLDQERIKDSELTINPENTINDYKTIEKETEINTSETNSNLFPIWYIYNWFFSPLLLYMNTPVEKRSKTVSSLLWHPTFIISCFNILLVIDLFLQDKNENFTIMLFAIELLCWGLICLIGILLFIPATRPITKQQNIPTWNSWIVLASSIFTFGTSFTFFHLGSLFSLYITLLIKRLFHKKWTDKKINTILKYLFYISLWGSIPTGIISILIFWSIGS